MFGLKKRMFLPDLRVNDAIAESLNELTEAVRLLSVHVYRRDAELERLRAELRRRDFQIETERNAHRQPENR